MNHFFDYYEESDEHVCEWGLESCTNQVERQLWLGHSLPPEISDRFYSTRSNWQEEKMTEMVEKITGSVDDVSLSRFHRTLRDAVEFVSEFGSESPANFEKMLLEYLAD
jgi:hypothetical protein